MVMLVICMGVCTLGPKFMTHTWSPESRTSLPSSGLFCSVTSRGQRVGVKVFLLTEDSRELEKRAWILPARWSPGGHNMASTSLSPTQHFLDQTQETTSPNGPSVASLEWEVIGEALACLLLVLGANSFLDRWLSAWPLYNCLKTNYSNIVT